MPGRITLVLLFLSNWSAFSLAATTPLAVAELAATRAIAESDVARAQAEQDLAKWKLDQLEALQSRGHASWQEVAEQQVVLKKQTAIGRAAKQFLEAVSHWQAGLAETDGRPSAGDTECIRLYLPGALRLVGWIPAEQASHELVSRQLEKLTAEQESLSNIDLNSLEAAVAKARKVVDVYAKSATDTHLLRRAKIRLRLATAEYDLARARGEQATIVTRRIALLRKHLLQAESSSSLARIGTAFVDSSGDSSLAKLVRTMASERASTVEYVAWLERQSQAMVSRIEKLEKLSHYPAADPRELELARSQKTAIDESIQHSTSLLRMHRQIASGYKALPRETVAGKEQLESATIESAWFTDATLVRHLLQQQKLVLQTEADRRSIIAEQDYLTERLRRVESIRKSARQPHELKQLRETMQSNQQLIQLVDRRLVQLGREKERFLCQFDSQCRDDYQLVQAADGKFFSRAELAAGEALVAAMGFLGEIPKSFTRHAYIESTEILGCLPELDRPQTSVLAGLGLGVTGPTHESLRLGTRPSIWGSAVASSSRLRLATDGITYANGLSCSAPHDLWRLYSDHPVSPRDYLRSVSAFQSRIPIYSSNYAFGIRRLDGPSASKYRRRANGYGSPWYLPGSPTNYRD